MANTTNRSNAGVPPTSGTIFGGGSVLMGGGNPITKDQEENPLFSDLDPGTDTTESHLDMRPGTNEDWPFFAQMYHHEYKVVLKPIKDLIGRVDRQANIIENLEESGLNEREDWLFDEDEQVLYLRDSYFLLAWKMENCHQFEKSIDHVVCTNME